MEAGARQRHRLKEGAEKTGIENRLSQRGGVVAKAGMALRDDVEVTTGAAVNGDGQSLTRRREAPVFGGVREATVVVVHHGRSDDHGQRANPLAQFAEVLEPAIKHQERHTAPLVDPGTGTS